jgi:hypothetical protein
MARRPVLENRPGTDLSGLQSALIRYTQELQAYLDSLGLDLQLPNVGPGAGTYGGDGDIVESLTLDAKGRTTALVTTARGTVEGSVMSMVGPGGAAAPIVAYDFTRYDPAASDAANLVAANQSGNSAYDLTAVGGGLIRYQSQTSSPSQSPYGWTPSACSVEGGALTSVVGGADYAATTGSPAPMQLLGAFSAEWLGYITATPTGNFVLFSFDGGASETEANNILYRLTYVVADNQWEYFHEAGAGTDSAVAWFVDGGGEADIAANKHNPMLFTVTRNGSDGNVALYINGRRAGTADDGSTGDFPTGGTTSNLNISPGGTNGRQLTLAFRLFNVELTAAQVRASYQRTFFGVST